MEMTYEEAERLLQKRLAEYPKVSALVGNVQFETSIKGILLQNQINPELFEPIKHEVMVVVAFYAPISKLAQNITETTGIPLETTEKISSFIESITLAPVIDDLYTYESLWEMEIEKEALLPKSESVTKERLELRPKEGAIAGTPAKPLTREELMNALAGTRTMAQDIEAARLKREGTPPPTAPQNKPLQ